MPRMLLVRSQYMPDAVTSFIQLIVDRQNRAARKAEYGLRSLFDEAFNQYGCSTKFHLRPSFTLLLALRNHMEKKQSFSHLGRMTRGTT